MLLVEDDPAIADGIRDALEAAGHEVTTAGTGADGLIALGAGADLVVLDLGLPDLDGVEVCRAIRRTSVVPVIVVSARSAEVDRVQVLEMGADDYLVKPFAFPELVARIRALLRRGRAEPATTLAHGDLVVELTTRRVSRGGQALDLTGKELAVLEYLLRQQGRVVTREMLARDVWQVTARATPLDNVIDVTIARLRRKVDDPFPTKLVRTVRGVGFVLGERP